MVANATPEKSGSIKGREQVKQQYFSGSSVSLFLRFPGIITCSLFRIALPLCEILPDEGLWPAQVFRFCWNLGRFTHVDFSCEPRTGFHGDTGAENIPFDIRALGQRDHAFTVDVSDKFSEDGDGAGMNVGLDPAVCTHRQMLIVMRARTLEVTFND